ncbi:MAG: hypothetical protein ACYC1K_01950 [Minisyncoccota bacterium]
MESQATTKKEFGDFQTPAVLADECCRVLRELGVEPRSLFEPTCGVGNFLVAGLDAFPTVSAARAFDINADYVAQASAATKRYNHNCDVTVEQGDFFSLDWDEALSALPSPTLVLGNPPWITNAALGLMRSANLPEKTNFQGRSGFDAISGKSNFDISEWMLIRLFETMSKRNAIVAMLCKTAVARKALVHIWKNGIGVNLASVYHIDAAMHFNAAVDACLLVAKFTPEGETSTVCSVFGSLSVRQLPLQAFGYRDGQLVSDVNLYERHKSALGGASATYRWRSGVKHDCSRVMELARQADGRFKNGHGEIVDLESEYLFPMMKSSDVARDGELRSDRWMLVTQRKPSDDTAVIELAAPRTWKYLVDHAAYLDSRGSSIYAKRSRFAVFGIGEYAFAPWKVAISGMYKKLQFRTVGPRDGRPTVLDDTCYFLACDTEDEANTLAGILNSERAQECFRAFVFWDNKRPITAEILNAIRLEELIPIAVNTAPVATASVA